MKRQSVSTNLSFLALATALLFAACQSGTKSSTAQPTAPASAATSAPAATPRPQFIGGPTGKSGTQLWAENCTRCHNNRSPTSYSDAQWEVAMHHMRIRANLTAEEHQKILEFLQSAN